MFKRLLIFAGTIEGRRLCEYCTEKNIFADVCVATDYGKELITPSPNINVISGRLDKEKMEALIKVNKYTCVIDATHPYASLVTQNIISACENTDTGYFRVTRSETDINNDDVIFCDGIEEAVELLNTVSENIFVATGCKELAKYKNIDDYSRLYVRVLPTVEALNVCIDFGLSSKNIICMQGPFTKELNSAMLKQTDCRYMVTKSSGKEGGFDEKIQAAIEVGVKTIVIKRPEDEKGYSLIQILEMLEELQ